MPASRIDEPRVIVALDFSSGEQTLKFVTGLQPGSCRLKVGKELFTRAGPSLVRELSQAGFDVFLDLKYHDIPNTVARACEAAAELGVWMLNVHASGGVKMMQAAHQALEASAIEHRPLLIGVTVLTSMSDQDLAEFFGTLPDKARDSLLRKPSKEMYKRLRDGYLQQTRFGPGGRGHRGPHRPGPDGRPFNRGKSKNSSSRFGPPPSKKTPALPKSPTQDGKQRTSEKDSR